MRRLAAALLLGAGTTALAAPPMLLSNQTSRALVSVRLAPAGSGHWSGNECENDPDGAVEPGGHLRLTGIAAGRYDVEVTDRASRVCRIHGLELKADRPTAATLTDMALRDCSS